MHPYFAPRKRAELYSAVVADFNINAFFGAIRIIIRRIIAIFFLGAEYKKLCFVLMGFSSVFTVVHSKPSRAELRRFLENVSANFNPHLFQHI
jgi:hypothetical protein